MGYAREAREREDEKGLYPFTSFNSSLQPVSFHSIFFSVNILRIKKLEKRTSQKGSQPWLLRRRPSGSLTGTSHQAKREAMSGKRVR